LGEVNAKALELEKVIREKNSGVSANNRCLFREDFSFACCQQWLP
jgi:hypothetical protein